MKLPIVASLFALAPLAVTAQPAAPAPMPATAPTPLTAPKLIVAISVDQLSADLFQQYRNRFTGGFARLLDGVVFPSGYQSHAATETCPGHSTILTGNWPAHTGIVANSWINQKAPREDKIVYCAEDEAQPGTTHEKYVPSVDHLKVPTLGDRMKAANPAARVVAVAGKDRAALMMGGHHTDEAWFWTGQGFGSLPGRIAPPVVTRANAAVTGLLAKPQAALPVPGYCTPLDQPVAIGDQTLGTGHFVRAAGDSRSFRASPALDAATLALAAGLVQDMKLGQGAQTDLIAVGASATDYVGHAYGPGGVEMCIHLAQLDQALGSFFATLDSYGIDYQVVLTADHGGHDITERQQQRAMPMEQRVSAALSIADIGTAIGREMNLPGPVLLGSEGDIYVADNVPAARKPAVVAATKKRLLTLPQVAAALTAQEIAATPFATSPPETWTLAERARASYDPARSGDLLILLKPRVTGIAKPGVGYVATHGSPWDYDRRVPILFWRKGVRGFEQPLSVQTIDIAPTLAAELGVATTGMDGRCLDLDAGAASTCG